MSEAKSAVKSAVKSEPKSEVKGWSPEVADKFSTYPAKVKPRLLALRKLILSLEPEVGSMTETLKWGEPSYQTKTGSTVRFDWKDRSPDTFAIYFICTTRLVETFEEIYGDAFVYDGNRALVFPVKGRLPTKPLKHCLSLAFRYHKLKHLPLLGA
jgi:hypothetical protein